MITTHSHQAIFWVLESMIPFGNHPLFLLLLGWMLPPKPAFMKLTTTPAVRAMTFTKQVFQDIVLPINKLEDQINKVSSTSMQLKSTRIRSLQSHELFDTYPVLVYPCRIYDHGPHTGQLRHFLKDNCEPTMKYKIMKSSLFADRLVQTRWWRGPIMGCSTILGSTGFPGL